MGAASPTVWATRALVAIVLACFAHMAITSSVVWLEQHYARLVQLEATIMRLEGDISANLCVTLHPDTTCATCACA